MPIRTRRCLQLTALTMIEFVVAGYIAAVGFLWVALVFLALALIIIVWSALGVAAFSRQYLPLDTQLAADLGAALSRLPVEEQRWDAETGLLVTRAVNGVRLTDVDGYRDARAADPDLPGSITVTGFKVTKWGVMRRNITVPVQETAHGIKGSAYDEGEYTKREQREMVALEMSMGTLLPTVGEVRHLIGVMERAERR